MLVVDDDNVMRGLLQRLLTRLGCSVEGAENGRVALERLGVPEGVDEDEPIPESSASRSYDGMHIHDIKL